MDKRKLVRVTFEYDSGEIEELTGNAHEWLEWIDGYVVHGQLRTGIDDKRGMAFQWKPVSPTRKAGRP